MKILNRNCQEFFCCRPLNSRAGFSLIELLVAVAITVITLVGVSASFRSFTKHSGGVVRENETNASIKATLQLLKRDLNMAGFGLPAETRIAENDQFETALESDFTNNYDSNGDGDSGDTITEASLSYDLNGDGDQADDMYRDRLFIADGWTILEDITDNGATDGDIYEGDPNDDNFTGDTTDYFYEVANKKESDGGFTGALSADGVKDSPFIQVSPLNINSGFEFQAPAPNNHKGEDDFLMDGVKDGAVILFGEDTATGVFSLEGHPIGSINGNTISFANGELLENSHTATKADPVDPTIQRQVTKVVPAVTWTVQQKAGDLAPWLYRNMDKVLPHVVGFQVSFGFDSDNKGLEWYATMPPTAGTEISVAVNGEVDGIAINNTNEGNYLRIIHALRAVRVVITAVTQGSSDGSLPTLRTYEEVVVLKN